MPPGPPIYRHLGRRSNRTTGPAWRRSTSNGDARGSRRRLINTSGLRELSRAHTLSGDISVSKNRKNPVRMRSSRTPILSCLMSWECCFSCRSRWWLPYACAWKARGSSVNGCFQTAGRHPSAACASTYTHTCNLAVSYTHLTLPTKRIV